MSTRERLAEWLCDHGSTRLYSKNAYLNRADRLIADLGLDDLAAADARVADLEAGIRREIRHLSGDLLCGPECVADHLRALVDDETPGTGDGA